MTTLNHALLTMKDLPLEQRNAWQGIFNHYIFEADEETSAHIPEKGRGVLGPLDEALAKKIRAMVISRLNR